jgi:hypothetical protein
MNPDGSPGLDVEAEAGVEIPSLLGIAIGLLVAGFVVAAVGIGLIAMAARAARKPAG